MKEIWLIRKLNGYTTPLTWCHFYGSEEELTDWFKNNNITIIGFEQKQDSFGMVYNECQLSIPCNGIDYDRVNIIKDTVLNSLVKLGCSTENVNTLLHSHNFDKEFIANECDNRTITIDYLYIAVSKYESNPFSNDNRFMLKSLLDNFWEILYRECNVYKR